MLSKNAMIVNLSISVWTARKKAHAAENTVTATYGADHGAVEVHKNLIDRVYLEEIRTIAGQARTYHYSATLPWADNGARVLPGCQFSDYVARMAQFQAEFSAAVERFRQSYGEAVSGAAQRLGRLFNPSEYPEFPTDLFGMRVSCQPIPEVSDFRIDMTDAEREFLTAQVSEQNRDAIRGAMLELVGRVRERVAHMAEKLADGGIFRDSLVANVAEICDTAAMLNIIDDPTFDREIAAIRETLAAATPATLRESSDARTRTAAQAAEAVARLDALAGMWR